MAHHDRLPQEARKFLAMFGRGRALLGRRIDTPWSYDGFLTTEQTRVLHDALVELRAADPPIQGQQPMGGFIDELVGWLATIESAGKDLWFDCY